MNELVQRCATKKSELEKNIQNVEVQRREVYTAVQRLLDDVGQAYSIKAKKLEENHRNLIERIDAIKRSFDDDLNVLKSNDRKRINSICSSITLVANDRLGHLETDSLTAHTLLCEELDAMLKKATDRTSAAVITKKAQEKRFKPAHYNRLALGSISESTTYHTSAAVITKKAQEKRFKPADDTRLDLGSILESTTGHASAAAITKKAQEKRFKSADDTRLDLGSILESTTGHASAAAITKKAQEKRFKSADDTRLDLGSILESTTGHASAAAITKKAQKKTSKPAYATHLGIGRISESVPKLEVIRCVGLRGRMSGMTPYSDDSAAIGYSDANGIDIIDSAGTQEQYANIPSNMVCCDILFQQDRSLCISKGVIEAHIYSPNGSRKSTIHMKGNIHCETLQLNRSPSDEILISNSERQVYIYDSTGSTLKHTIPIHNTVRRVSSTSSGLIVTSSCYDPSVVTVYDREGDAGKSLQAPYNEWMYAAVDEQDRVYVASCNTNNFNLVIRLYDLDGLNLKERVECKVLHLKSFNCWCHLVSLSPDMLAFACDDQLYFIKVSL